MASGDPQILPFLTEHIHEDETRELLLNHERRRNIELLKQLVAIKHIIDDILERNGNILHGTL